MIRPCLPWLTSLLVCVAIVAALTGRACAASAEVKLDSEYLAGLIEKLPPLPFENAGQVARDGSTATAWSRSTRGRGGSWSACMVDGEYRPPISGVRSIACGIDDGTWRRFRFEVRVGINVEPGRDGTPKFRIAVEDVRRKELEGLAGTLAKLLGKYFDDVVTRVAAGQGEPAQRQAQRRDRQAGRGIPGVRCLRRHRLHRRRWSCSTSR